MFDSSERSIQVLTIFPSLFASEIFSSQFSLLVITCTFPPLKSILSSESSPPPFYRGWKKIYKDNKDIKMTEL